MSKPVRVLLFIAGLLVFVIATGKLTNTLVISKASSGANEPGMKTGSWILASNLVRPRTFTFIVFNSSSIEEKRMNRVYRVIGMPGDTIEIKLGNTYLNGRYIDDDILLNHMYTVSIGEFNKMDEIINFGEGEYYSSMFSRDSVMLFTNKKLLDRFGVSGNRPISLPEREESFIESVWGRKWNKDNFGPVVVPAEMYFVLGDNRDNAQDSRYLGFINHADYRCTVFW
ncbi:MAG: signal peptidase I [Chitinophagaceae bacterium]|nr:signal peptidase I [Chitinophagaceae bacterium]MCW5929315.1 signal peptidase I [Chitinophagaceae bacterium]